MSILKYFTTDEEIVLQNETPKFLRIKLCKLLEKRLMTKKIDLMLFAFMKKFAESYGSVVNAQKFADGYSLIRNKQSDEYILRLFPNLFSLQDCLHVEHEEMTKLMISESQFDFSDDQYNGLVDIFKFLVGYDNFGFRLSGYAGTGKTTLITELVGFLLRRRFIKKVAFSAPTHKAVNIMKAKFKRHLDEILGHKSLFDQLEDLKSNDLIVEFVTLHKLLGYAGGLDMHGERIFEAKYSPKTCNYDFIIIDESSMVSLDIVSHFVNLIMKNLEKGDVPPKVLFLGDPAQLPPVNELVSFLFIDEKTPINKFNFGHLLNDKIKLDNLEKMKGWLVAQPGHLLKKVVRTDVEKMMNMWIRIRDWVSGDIDDPHADEFKGIDVKISLLGKRKKLETKWFKRCLDLFSKKGITSYANVIILTWTNRQSDEYNSVIRKMIFKRKNLNRYEIGDLLILSDFYQMEESNWKDAKDSTSRFYTSEQVRVIDIDHVIKSCKPFPTKFTLSKTIKHQKEVGNKYNGLVGIINKDFCHGYPVWKLYVQKIADATVADHVPETYTLYVIKEDHKKKLENAKNSIRDKIQKFHRFLEKKVEKNQLRMLENQIVKKLWQHWNAVFVEPFANLSYGYSITVHKSQGSTYCTVFVDIDDICKNRNENECKRCVYTSVTRASHKLNLLV
jgi:hypothetical protein